MKKLDKIKLFSEKNSRLLLWLFIIIYIVLFSILSLKKYDIFAYNVFDLAIFNQVFWNTLHGNWFDMTVNINIYLADHFTPIIFLLIPFYAIYPKAESLLILQNIFLALSTWPIWLVTKYISKDKIMALIVALLWLFNPFVHNTNLYEFHLLPIAIFFIFWVFYFYQKNNFKLFLLFFILALLVREDISIVLFSFSILAFFDKRKLTWKLTPIILSAIYFVLAIKIISFFNTDDAYKFLIYYRWLGGNDILSILWNWLIHPLQFLGHILSFKNIINIIALFLPLLFLPLLKPKYLWLTLLPFLQFILSSSGFSNLVIFSHYVLLFLPAIFISLIFALDKIKKRQNFWGSKFIYNNLKISSLIFAVTVIYFLIFLSPIKNILFYDQPANNIDKKQEFLSVLPERASVAAQVNFLPHLSSRQTIYPISYAYFGRNQFASQKFVLPQVDYILLDYNEFISILIDRNNNGLFTKYRSDMPDNWRQLLENYNLIKAENNLHLWENNQKTTEQDLLLYDTISKYKETEGVLVDHKIITDNNQRALQLTLAPEPYQRDYLIRFYQADKYFDIPLDYGFYMLNELDKSKFLQVYYYLSDDVDSWQIFSWQGNNLLGDMINAVVELDLDPLTDRVDL